MQNADAGSDTGQQLSELLQSAQVTASDSAAGGLLTSDKNSPIGGLLGNGSVPSALGGLLGNSNSGTDPFLDTLLAQGGSAKPFEQAVSAAAQAKASTKAQSQDYLSNLGAFHAGFNAYNKVLQQNAAAAIKASQQAQASVEA
ncbi:MAG: hypothetical protein EBV03_08755 [Proteobacteria bacterium]|nr:hypothetical protein [Pseudomonadota bacterium]